MKVFLAVADAASFSAAARALGVSKAMVSKHVAHLEDSLGVRLLQRSTRWMRLTEAGSTYQEGCRRILADIDETERVVAALHAEPRGLLRVAAPRPRSGATIWRRPSRTTRPCSPRCRCA